MVFVLICIIVLYSILKTCLKLKPTTVKNGGNTTISQIRYSDINENFPVLTNFAKKKKKLAINL